MDKNILITGSSYGIGFGIAKFLNKKNLNLIITSRNIKRLKGAQKKLNSKNVKSFKCDFENNYSVLNLMKKLKIKMKKIDVIICNVGSGKTSKSGDENYNIWQSMFKKNFFSATNVIENYLKIFKDNSKNSKIIVIGSIAGDFKGRAPLSYSLAKNCLIKYVENISPILAKKNITINTISPGHVLIENNNWHKKLKKNKKEVKNMINRDVSLRRFCTINDITDTVDFLISNKANYINGINLILDGKTKQ